MTTENTVTLTQEQLSKLASSRKIATAVKSAVANGESNIARFFEPEPEKPKALRFRTEYQNPPKGFKICFDTVRYLMATEGLSESEAVEHATLPISEFTVNKEGKVNSRSKAAVARAAKEYAKRPEVIAKRKGSTNSIDRALELVRNSGYVVTPVVSADQTTQIA